MDWLDRLNSFKRRSRKTTDEISKISGIPKGTLNKLFAGQTKDPQLSTVRAVVHCLGYTLDDLEPGQELLNAKTLPDEAIEVAEAYCCADFKSKNIARQVLDLPSLKLSSENSEIAAEFDIEKELADYRRELEAEQKGIKSPASDGVKGA